MNKKLEEMRKIRAERLLSQKQHRETYPDQYTHELVGKTVQAQAHGDPVFVVERVVPSRFGLLAIPVGRKSHNPYSVSRCTVIEEN